VLPGIESTRHPALGQRAQVVVHERVVLAMIAQETRDLFGSDLARNECSVTDGGGLGKTTGRGRGKAKTA